MTIYAYLRVSTEEQDLNSQKLAIHEYAHKNKIEVNHFIEAQVSSRKSPEHRKITGLLDSLVAGDTLIVSELSRLGRSLGQIIGFIDEFVKKKVNFIAIKEDIKINGKHSVQSKVMITMIGLFAELERDLISQRTKEGLANAKAKGKTLGRPKGSTSKSKLDGKEHQISELLEKGVTKSNIAKILDVSRPALNNFIKTRNLSS